MVSTQQTESGLRAAPVSTSMCSLPETSYIKVIGAWICGKLALKMLDLDLVMPPAFGLQPPRKQMKMGMFPGSSTVEHSAVNREP